MNTNDRRENHPRIRKGIAPLELVLALPMLAAFWVLLMWLGKAVVAQAHVTVEARRQTTAERFDVTEGDPLLFFNNGLVTGDETTLSRTVEQRVPVNRLTERLPIPESTFAMQAGTWDHRQLPLDDAPSWTEIVTIAASGKLAGFQGAIATVMNIADDPGDFATGAFASIGGGSGGGTSGDGVPLPESEKLDDSNVDPDKRSESDPEKLKKRRDNADEKLNQLQPQLLESNLEVLKLEALETALSATTNHEKLRSVREQLEIERYRNWRIKSDIRYYKTDRDRAQSALDAS
jgi:hypothetical protein